MSDNPMQVTDPKSASKQFTTDRNGVIYPKENTRVTNEFLSGQGSMGFDRNQGVEREGFNPPEVQGGTMGQHNLQKHKTTGSHAI